MVYSDFTVSRLEAEFGLQIRVRRGLFREAEPRAISETLRKTLAYNVGLATAIGSEKARSEMIISPLLVELKQQKNDALGLFSGIEFNVDARRGLTGVCDFLLSQSPQQFEPTAPVVILVEAKRDDFRRGLPQCVAEMVAARLFNEERKKPISPIYGAVTIGTVWQFVRMENEMVEASGEEYTIEDPEKIFGILWQMVS